MFPPPVTMQFGAPLVTVGQGTKICLCMYRKTRAHLQGKTDRDAFNVLSQTLEERLRSRQEKAHHQTEASGEQSHSGEMKAG